MINILSFLYYKYKLGECFSRKVLVYAFDDWDGMGSKKISKEAFKNAKDLFEIFGDDFCKFSVWPTKNEHLTLYFDLLGTSLNIILSDVIKLESRDPVQFGMSDHELLFNRASNYKKELLIVKEKIIKLNNMHTNIAEHHSTYIDDVKIKNKPDSKLGKLKNSNSYQGGNPLGGDLTYA